MNAPAHCRLLLVDDHTIVREGLKRIFESNGLGWTVAEESSGFRALDTLRRQAFDVAVVDLSMPGMNGLELTRRIRAEWPHLPVLVLSMHDEEEYALRAFKAGANGYITKDRPVDELQQAVHKVAGGGAFVTASLAERVVQQLNGNVDVPRHSTLSERELQVLQRLVAGQRLTDIAEAMHLSIKTISTHKSRVMEKLQLDSTAALIRYGLQHGLSPESLEAAADDAGSEPAGWNLTSTRPGAL
jgi:DNA-binding NarL/FixJ family response regulator